MSEDKRSRPGLLDGMTEHRRDGEAVTYIGVREGSLVAIGWRSHKQEKPAFRWRFKDADSRERALADWWVKHAQSVREQEERRAKTKAAREQAKDVPDRPNPFKVNDVVFYTLSWGGDHSPCFFQVLEVKKKTVIVQEIQSEPVIEDPKGSAIRGVEENDVVARREKFAERSEPLAKVVQWDKEGKPYLSFEPRQSAYLWDGRRVFAATGWY